MPDGNQSIFTVTDLKQYFYCHRILYYHSCLPDVRPITYKMQAGMRKHENEPKRSLRRTMSLPDIADARREFNVHVCSEELGLTGQIDEILFFDDYLVPVDYKLAKLPGKHFEHQLAAYAIMAEETFDIPAPRGILYLIRQRQSVEVIITKRLRNAVYEAIAMMSRIADTETIPEATNHRTRCAECEFRRYCNDV